MTNKDIHKWTDGRYTLMFDEHTFFVWDNEKDERMCALEVTEKLNEQQAIINKQLDQIIELQDKYRILEFNHSRLEKRNKVQYEKIGEQQDQIIYWKHKVNGLLFILSQFDEEKVKELLKELDDE